MRTVVSILAGYRMIRLIQIDSITEPMRAAVWGWLARHRRFKSLRKLLNCPFCLSFWIAALIIAGNAWFGPLWWLVLRIFALWAVIGFLAWLDHEHIG